MKPSLLSCSLSLVLAVLTCLLCNGLAQDEKGPERWENDMAKFEARDKETSPSTNALLFVGSSSIRMWDLETSWPDSETINNGFGGSTFADSIYHFDRLFPRYQPSAIILYEGDNDISIGLTPEQVSAAFVTLTAKITEVFPKVPVVFIAIKPSRKRWEMWPTMKRANDMIAARCAENENLYFADIAKPMLEGQEGAPDASWFIADGLHLSKSGYEKWTNLIQGILKKAKVLP